MSTTTVTEVTRAVCAAVGQQIRQNFHNIATQALANNQQGLQTLPTLEEWLRQAADQTAAGAGTISVQVAGGGGGPLLQAQGGANPLAGMVANVGLSLANSTPFAQAGGLAAFAGNAPGAPNGGNNLPKNGVRTLAECGVCRVPIHQSPVGPNNQKAMCGFTFSKRDLPGQTFFCTAEATAQNSNCNLWSCPSHKKNKGPDPSGRGGGKKSDLANAPLVSAQQVNALRSPTGIPTGFQSNPGMVGNLANMMAQTPQIGFNNAPMAGGLQNFQQQPQQYAQPNFQQQPSNQQLSHALMNSATPQIAGIQQTGLAPAGANVNMATLMQQPAPQQVSIAGFSPMGGQQQQFQPQQQVQFNPQQFQTQPGVIAPIQFQESNDESDSDDDDEDEDLPISTPLPVTSQVDLASALSAAGTGLQNFQQQPQGGFNLSNMLQNQQQVQFAQPQGGLNLAGMLQNQQQAPQQVQFAPQQQSPLAGALQNAQQAPPQQQVQFAQPQGGLNLSNMLQQTAPQQNNVLASALQQAPQQQVQPTTDVAQLLAGGAQASPQQSSPQ